MTRDISHLSGFTQWLQEYTNLLANKKSFFDRPAESDFGRKVYRWSRSISGRWAANKIGFNMRTPATNFIPLAQLSAEVSTPNIVKAAINVLTNPLSHNFTDTRIKSEFLAKRLYADDPLHKSNFQRINDVAFAAMRAVDGLSSRIVVEAKYLQNIKDGMTEVAAIENADR